VKVFIEFSSRENGETKAVLTWRVLQYLQWISWYDSYFLCCYRQVVDCLL